MRANEIKLIMEAGSRGIYVRTKSAATSGNAVIFKNQSGKTITAVDNTLFPEVGYFYENDKIQNLPKQAKKLPLADQKKLLQTGKQRLLADLESYRQKINISEQNWNIVNDNGRAALVTLWKNIQGELIAYVKLFNIKSSGPVPFFWSNSDFARDTGYAIQNSSQQKSELNLKPSTVVGTGKYLTVDDVIEQIKVNIPTRTELPIPVQEQIVELINNVYSGYNTPVQDAAEFSSSYEIDLGETAAPIALLTGHFVSGAYREVEEQLLKPLGSSWKKIKTVGFPMNDTEVLIDSVLNLKNTQIGISSKDSKGGAAASVTSLLTAIEKNPERFEDMKAENKYKYLFSVIKLIKDKSAEDAPLDLGVIYKFITKEEKAEIKKVIQDPHMDKRYLSKGLKVLLKNPTTKPNTESSNYTVGYHLLTIVANLVTDHLNKKSNIVTTFFKEILSRSNMIQIKTTISKSGTGAYFSNFNVIWPPIFDGQVKFYSKKNYSASARPGGKICFKIG
jgi:hypothetical protein